VFQLLEEREREGADSSEGISVVVVAVVADQFWKLLMIHRQVCFSTN
jgi:hypothetical protein